MCTNLTFPNAKGRHVLSARTMDFEKTFDSSISIVPRNRTFPSIEERTLFPSFASWENTYGFIGVNLFGLNYFTEGMNEKGLSAALLWLPGTQYPTNTTAEDKILFMDVVSWILGNFDTVDKVYDQLQSKAGIISCDWNSFTFLPKEIREIMAGLTVHFSITDANGEHLVIEFMNHSMQLYRKDCTGVLTNAPEYTYHLNNLSNYENLSTQNNTTKWWGQEINGSGMLGMPGDATPPSRFVRASVMRNSEFIKDESQNEEEKVQRWVNQALQMIQTCSVPLGSVTKKNPNGTGTIPITEKDRTDYTIWTCVRDHSDCVMYFNTYENTQLRYLDLKSINFDHDRIVRAELLTSKDWKTKIEPITEAIPSH